MGAWTPTPSEGLGLFKEHGRPAEEPHHGEVSSWEEAQLQKAGMQDTRPPKGQTAE